MARRRRRKPTAREQPRDPLDVAGRLYPTLDLHGSTADEAVVRTRRWLLEQQRAGEGVVRVITGRGMHSVGPPVLPQAISDLLAELKGDSVRSFEFEPGGGVVRVRLKAAKETRVERRSSKPIPPSLVREAEEALAELGIAPTPALIEAEVRRIRAERGL